MNTEDSALKAYLLAQHTLEPILVALLALEQVETGQALDLVLVLDQDSALLELDLMYQEHYQDYRARAQKLEQQH